MHVTIELTKDPELLNQYYKLREDSFRDKLGISSFNGEEDELDKQSNILIARIGNRCIGGVRICGGGHSQKLPLEEREGFLAEQFPDLDLQPTDCCQWMRFTLCPQLEYSKAYMQNQFILATAKFSSALGYKYGLCVSSKIHHRFYKRTFSKYGYDYKSGGDLGFSQPNEFDGLEHVLYFTDLYSPQEDGDCPAHIDLSTSFHLDLQLQTASKRVTLEVAG